MKTYLIIVDSGEAWEMCPNSVLVTADSKEEAIAMIDMEYFIRFRNSPSIDSVEELDLSVKGSIIIQEAVIE